MEIGNCSLLDEGHGRGRGDADDVLAAFAREAVREGRNQLFVDRNLFPQTLDVLLTRSEPFGIEPIVDDYDEYEFTGREFGAVVQYPAADGAVRDYADFTAAAHARGARHGRLRPAGAGAAEGARRVGGTSPSARRSGSGRRWASAARRRAT